MYRLMKSEKFTLDHLTSGLMSFYRQTQVECFRYLRTALGAYEVANSSGGSRYYLLNESGQDSCRRPVKLIVTKQQRSTRRAPPPLALEDAHLFRVDSEYTPPDGEDIVMGGVSGRLDIAGVLTPAWWRLLILGQYTGIGQRVAFGFGRYQLCTADGGASYRRPLAAASLLMLAAAPHEGDPAPAPQGMGRRSARPGHPQHSPHRELRRVARIRRAQHPRILPAPG